MDTKSTELAFLAEQRILYVEDADFARESLAYYLKRYFKRVDVASDGKKGLALFQSQPYDLVLTDISMPVMDGIEMTRQIRASQATLPIIVITAHSEEETRQSAVAAGATDFLVKPLFPEKVRDAIYRSLIAQQSETTHS